MSEILDNIFIWVFLVNIESVLVLALVRYMLCSHFTQNCMLLYFLEAKSPYFVTKNCWKSSYICVFILSKKRRNWFHKNLHNSGMAGRRKLPDPSLNCIFNALSIGVQYILSFQRTNFGLKCLLWPLCPVIGTPPEHGTPAKRRNNAGTTEHHRNNGTPPEQSKYRGTAEHYDWAMAE